MMMLKPALISALSLAAAGWGHQQSVAAGCFTGCLIYIALIAPGGQRSVQTIPLTSPELHAEPSGRFCVSCRERLPPPQIAVQL